MKTAFLHGSSSVFSEIIAEIAAPIFRAVSIKRLNKHTYVCRIEDRRFVFRTPRTDPRQPPRGPGIELRHTLPDADAPPADIHEIRGRPGVIRGVVFDSPLRLHIERMDDRSYWCRIGDHEFSVTAPGTRSPGVELVSAGPSSTNKKAP